MNPACQYNPKGLKGDWIPLYLHCIYLMHQVSVVTSGEQKGFIPSSPFLSSDRPVGFTWVQFGPFFEHKLLISHHNEQDAERCSDILTDPYVPSLDGGWN